jgi:hypothetical protein
MTDIEAMEMIAALETWYTQVDALLMVVDDYQRQVDQQKAAKTLATHLGQDVAASQHENEIKVATTQQDNAVRLLLYSTGVANLHEGRLLVTDVKVSLQMIHESLDRYRKVHSIMGVVNQLETTPEGADIVVNTAREEFLMGVSVTAQRIKDTKKKGAA